MFETIVVAVDGSQTSDAAVSVAVGLALKTGSNVEVVHVHELHPAGRFAMEVEVEPPAESQAILDKAVDRVKAGGATAHGILLQARTREVPAAIMAEAEKVGADLIIIGRRGMSEV